MSKVSKKDIKKTVDTAMTEAMRKLEVNSPSKKTRKAISKVTKKIEQDLKKQTKKADKKPVGKAVKRVGSKPRSTKKA